MEKKLKRICMLFLLAMLGLIGIPLHAKADEAAVFHVQASEPQADGTIRVSVYLTDTANLGGIDAELIFDPGKVTYVDSGLGESFKGGYGETNCNEGSDTVKCVTVYPEAKTAHGELMYATFQLNGIESYQPEFRVVNMLDSSEEINPIPYTITYQQTDGSWTDAQDTSETLAEESVIAQARENYGAPEDKEQHSLRASSGNGISGNRIASNGTAGNGTSGNRIASNGTAGSGTSGNEAASNGTSENESSGEGRFEDGNSGNGDSEGSITGENFMGDDDHEVNPGEETKLKNEGTGEAKNGVQSNIMIIGIATLVIIIVIVAVVLIMMWSKKSWRKRNGR